MNQIIFALLLSVLSVSASATTLLEYSFQSGFSPNPVTTLLKVDSSGVVNVTETVLRSGKVTVTPIANLSAESLRSIEAKIKALNPNDQLTDMQPGAPRCTDAPSSTIFAYQAGTQIAIYSRASCHDFELQQGDQDLVALMQGLFAIR